LRPRYPRQDPAAGSGSPGKKINGAFTPQDVPCNANRRCSVKARISAQSIISLCQEIHSPASSHSSDQAMDNPHISIPDNDQCARVSLSSHTPLYNQGVSGT
jgi:hypothetical protein